MAEAGIAWERASPSPSSLAPALTSTSPSAWPSVCASEDVLGAGCGPLPRSPPLPPLRLPPAFSGRAACGCQSRGRAIRLRAGSGPAPSVFLIKEAAAETRGAEPSAAAPSSGGALALPPGRRPIQVQAARAPPPLSHSAPPSCPAHLGARPPVRHAPGKERPPGTSRAHCPWPHRPRRRETPRNRGGILVFLKFRDSKATHAEPNTMPRAMALQDELGGSRCLG